MNPTLHPCPVAALAGQPLWLLGLLRAKEERKGSAFCGERSRRKRFNIMGKYIRKMTLKIAQNLPSAWQLLFARQRGGGGGPHKRRRQSGDVAGSCLGVTHFGGNHGDGKGTGQRRKGWLGGHLNGSSCSPRMQSSGWKPGTSGCQLWLGPVQLSRCPYSYVTFGH